MQFSARCNKLKAGIDWQKTSAVLICSNPNIVYLTGYTNFPSDERDAYLLLTEKSNYLITDGRYSEAVKVSVPHFQVLERGMNNPVKKMLEEIIAREKLTTLGIEERYLTVSEYKFFKRLFKRLKDVDVSEVRVIKGAKEIKAIEEACKMGDKALSHILKKIIPDVTEQDLSAQFELFLRAHGSESSFPTIVGFDQNSAIPHHQTSNAKLDPKQTGNFVLIDSGAKVNGYCSDMTRTVFFGEPSEKQQKIYQAVLDAQTKAAELIDARVKAGKKIKESEVDQIARDTIEKAGFTPYNHALGHGIGLEVHESPVLSLRSDETLEQGMVFSIEPGIYEVGFGGVRIEDLFVIEKTGLRQLTQSPKKLMVI